MFAFIASLFAFITVRKVGGLYHWRIGRLGGSFYLAKAKARKPIARHLPAFGVDLHHVTVAELEGDIARLARRDLTSRITFAIRHPRPYSFAASLR